MPFRIKLNITMEGLSMKIKYLLCLIYLCVLTTSCGKDDSDSDGGATSLTNEQVASFASSGSIMAQSMSDTAIGYDSTPPSLAKYRFSGVEPLNSRSAAQSLSNYTFNNATNYWDLAQTLNTTSGTTSISYDYSLSIGLWEAGSLTQTVATALEKVSMYGNFDFTVADSSTGESVTLDMQIGGGSSSPFTWTGINTSTITMDGSFNFNITANGQAVTMTMTFNSLSIDQGGSNTYPTGTMTISVIAGSESFSGTIVYNGTSSAVATINGTTVSIDLDASALTTTMP